MKRLLIPAIFFTWLVNALTAQTTPLQISGIYPHLAAFNEYGECGIGAVVPWAGKLWWLTYPPHLTKGSNDPLRSVSDDLSMEERAESVGGTHACRMIHKESNQLIIGPYFIDVKGRVRACDVKTKLIGRLTAIARHLTDPANLVYFYDMEGAVYEVNVHTLDVKKLFVKPVPGWHGKGGYTAQGRLVISNNGETPAGKIPKDYLAKLPPKSAEDAGVLAEYDGKEWRIIERHQFTEVTGPGGINGSPDDKAPLWAMGWDKRSVILKLLDGGAWHTFRLPKSSYAFDPKHGWYTEWPRIREVTDGRWLAVMHGQMFDFPPAFSKANTAGIRPLCTHLRYIPDFCAWKNQIVLAADDTSIMQNEMAGQSQSNLWFGKWDDLKTFGPVSAWGGVWVGDHVKKGVPSDPFLFAGYAQRVLHISCKGDAPATFAIEVDAKGDGQWTAHDKITVPANGYTHYEFKADAPGEWVRLKPEQDNIVSAYFHLQAARPESSDKIGNESAAHTKALLRPAHDNRNLQVFTEDGYFEVDEKLGFTKQGPTSEATKQLPKLKIKPAFTEDEASIIVTDESGHRFRLPKHNDKADVSSRGWREVESERFLASIGGLFYETPRSTDKGPSVPRWRQIKPVAAHTNNIHDFCTWRGLLVMSGDISNAPSGKVFKAVDGKTSLWFGMVDDLWAFGKPTGKGGPWKNSKVKTDLPSDPYLMTNFDKKTITLSHDAKQSVKISIEVEFMNGANPSWVRYSTITVPAGETVTHAFPSGYNAHWVRVVTDADCKATAQLVYE